MRSWVVLVQSNLLTIIEIVQVVSSHETSETRITTATRLSLLFRSRYRRRECQGGTRFQQLISLKEIRSQSTSLVFIKKKTHLGQESSASTHLSLSMNSNGIVLVSFLDQSSDLFDTLDVVELFFVVQEIDSWRTTWRTCIDLTDDPTFLSLKK